MEQFQYEQNTLIEVLKKSPGTHACFSQSSDLDSETMLKFYINSNVKFDHLELSYFLNPLTLPLIATSIKLHGTRLNNYAIPGVKKLSLFQNSSGDRDQIYTFSSDLEDLYISARESIQVTLPPNLRKLLISAGPSLVDLVSEEMVNLEYFLLMFPNIQSFSETGIIAPNLKNLVLIHCHISNYDGLKQFQHLKDLELKCLSFPMSLFNDGCLPELESFTCKECLIHNTGDFDKSLSIFPPNLKTLELETCKFVNTEFSNWVLSDTLEILRISDLPFKDGFLGEYLKDVDVSGNELTLDSNFRIFHMVEEFTLYPYYLTFESLDFMYHLPNNILRLHLISNGEGKMSPLTQMVKWPLMLTDFAFRNFNIDNQTLELLNMKESNLEIIKICGGDVKKLFADLFPVSVKDLSLRKMGIQK